MVEASGLAAPWFTRLAVQGVTAKVMAAQDFLLDSQGQAWLDGLEPAWTLLTFESLQALRHEPAATRTAIRIANDLSCDEIARSSIARTSENSARRAWHSPQVEPWPWQVSQPTLISAKVVPKRSLAAS